MTEGNILIIAEQLGDNLLPVTYEIVSLARRLRGNKNADVEIAVAGHDILETGESIRQATGLDVQVLEIRKDSPCD